tara:strand:- start:361 stop:474 length:114 start_codon:yes stop_codon:yes gene_type:complete
MVTLQKELSFLEIDLPYQGKLSPIRVLNLIFRIKFRV